MHSTPLLLEEPIRMASILEPSKPSFFPAMTKIVGTLGPKSRSVDVISQCLEAGMSASLAFLLSVIVDKLEFSFGHDCLIFFSYNVSVARFDFSWGDPVYHQETLEHLRTAIKSTKKLCAVMLDTVGPELQVVNKTEHPISLQADTLVVLTPDQNKEAASNLLPLNFNGLSKAVKKGDNIFIGQYLFTGSETTSVWLEVSEVNGDDVTCVIKNSATLSGSLYTLHVSQIRIDLPTLTNKDKEVISTWGVQNNIDFLSLSFTRHAEDVRHAREFLSKLGDLKQTQIFAKIENIEGLTHFDEILREADGIILSRGNLGIDLPPEKVFLFQKAAIYKCNMAGKPAVVTRVVDTMTDNLRPTRAEATDVANAVLDGTDAIVLGAETLRGLYPVETISTVGKICAEAEKVYNQDIYFKKAVKFVGEPMTHLESITSSAVRAAIKVKASVIICFTSSGRAASCRVGASRDRPTEVEKADPNKAAEIASLRKVLEMAGRRAALLEEEAAAERRGKEVAEAEVLKAMEDTMVLINQSFDPVVRRVEVSVWGPPPSIQFDQEMEARQSLIVRGLFPMLADPRHPIETRYNSNVLSFDSPHQKQFSRTIVISGDIVFRFEYSIYFGAENKSGTSESILKVALDHGKTFGIIKPHDRVVVCQKVGDSSVVKIIELDD
ncbi:hypothetical protein ACSQ67_015643 [Phaseolus vulgaris]